MPGAGVTPGPRPWKGWRRHWKHLRHLRAKRDALSKQITGTSVRNASGWLPIAPRATEGAKSANLPLLANTSPPIPNHATWGSGSTTPIR